MSVYAIYRLWINYLFSITSHYRWNITSACVFFWLPLLMTGAMGLLEKTA
jgi:hypothetical protein